MIGVYNYTVLLTYLSLLTSGAGIVISLYGPGHPYMGTICLLLCGLFDAFDGKVARTKADRTDMEKKFGVQIDSLSDLVAFGVLPASIGAAFIRVSPYFNDKLNIDGIKWYNRSIRIFVYAILVLYILFAMIRLAYFNVTEEERQKTETGKRKYYLGMPVTLSAMFFPTVATLQYIIPVDLTWIYILTAVIVGILFVTPFKMKKPGFKEMFFMITVGTIEVAALIVTMIIRHYAK